MSMQTVLLNLKNAIEYKCNSLISSHNSNSNAHSNILSTVAKTGSYNDLSNKPNIPSAITVDSSLSTTSTNPVQNKIINTNLINSRNSIKEIMSLIIPYQVVEYIQSTSPNGQAQAINTGYILKADDIVEVTFSSQATSSFESVFGARKNSYLYNAYVYFCRFNLNNRSNYCRTRIETSGQNISHNTIYKVITNQGTCKVYNESGTLIDTINNTGTIEDCVNPCALFTLNTDTGTGFTKDSASHMKIYEFKITGADGSIKRHMIPVKHNGIGYMYDTVTGQLYGEVDNINLSCGPDINLKNVINPLKTWTTVYNKNDIVMKVNTTTREVQMEVNKTINISTANTDQLVVSDLPSEYDPPVAMKITAHNSITTVLMFSGGGKLYVRAQVAGSKSCAGIFRYVY